MRKWLFVCMMAGCFPESVRLPPSLSDVDGDGWTVADGDCDDGNASRFPGATEWCENGMDEDCDGADGVCRLAGVLTTEDADGALPGAPAVGIGDIDEVDGREWAVHDAEHGGWSLYTWRDGEPNAFGDIIGEAGCCDHLVSLGDVTGDGLDDVLIGTDQLYMGQVGERAEVYVLPGPFTNAVLPNHAWVVTGEVEDSIGQGLGGALDFNGDGIGDVVVGRPSLLGTRFGGASLLFGPVESSLDVSSFDVNFIGDAKGQGQGRIVAAVSDVNGDGLDEVLIGETGGKEWDSGHYGAVLFLGRDQGGDWSYDSSDARYMSESGEYSNVPSLAGLGDVDGDGYGDWAFGSQLAANYAGTLWVFSGGAEAPKQTGLLGAVATLEGPSTGDRFAADVDGLGDLNGDGHHDFMVGSPEFSTGDVAQKEGAVFVLYGPVEGTIRASLEDDEMTVVHGVIAQQQLGHMSDGPGDLDGDGFKDLLLSSPLGDGESWIFRTGSR